jgi:hypothetical protein
VLRHTHEIALSCRFDLANQLMDTADQEWKDGESQDPAPTWGMALPKDIKATNVSLLAEPTSQALGDNNPRRAVVLVYATDMPTCQFHYVVFRLQVFRNKVSRVQSASRFIQKPFYVMTHECLRGTLRNGTRSASPVSGIFLAGACFRYDLRKMMMKKKKSTTKSNVAEVDDFVVTLAVIRTPGLIEGLCLGHNDTSWVAPIVKSEVSRFWLSDIIRTNDLYANAPPIITLVWVIELLSGGLYSWSVPSVVCCSPGQKDDWQMGASFKEAKINRPRGLRLASLVCRKETRDPKKRWLLGSLCDLGSASDWVQQASLGSQSDVALGYVPDSLFGCILRSGQGLKRYRRTPMDGIDVDDFTCSLYQTDVFCQSPFLMTPPAFVSSLYILLLEAASLRTEIPIMEASNLSSMTSILESHQNRLKVCYFCRSCKCFFFAFVKFSITGFFLCVAPFGQIIENHVQHRLKATPNKDAAMMALRLIILRAVELLGKVHKAHSKEESDLSESNLLLCMTLFSEIVDAVRRCTTNLQFASLLLEVGRQVEPSNLEHLYPLPLPGGATTKTEGTGPSAFLDSFTARSVVDLFTLCIDEGSLAAAASALPLFTSKNQARHYCGLLLDEAIDSFVRNTHRDENGFDTTEVERRVIGDLFGFGMKLEDAELYEEDMATREMKKQNGTNHDQSDHSEDTIDYTVDSRSTMTDDSELADFAEKAGSSLICVTGTSTILNYIVPSAIRGETEQKREEAAIKREASAFIRSSLDNPALGFSTLPDWDDTSIPDAPKDDINSVAGIVGDALLDLLQPTRTDNNWKAMAAMARLLLQEGTKVPSSFGLVSDVAAKARPVDVLSILPESYDMSVEAEQNLTSYLDCEIDRCGSQVTGPSAAATIVDMALLVLDRIGALPLPDPGDQAVMELGLAFIVLVAGRTCGRSAEILDSLRRDCLLASCYEEVLQL